MGHVIRRRPAKPGALCKVKEGEVSFAKTCRITEHGVENWLQIAGGAEMTCNTSDVAVCCSSDSVSSRVRCCSASNNRTFSMAMTA